MIVLRYCGSNVNNEREYVRVEKRIKILKYDANLFREIFVIKVDRFKIYLENKINIFSSGSIWYE